MTPADHAQRLAALDPTHSCIVQAPAGSGKTTLLTLRYLALLARVEAPEEILAITFTRKAAAEMAERVLESLQLGQHPAPPESQHQQLTWNLAQAALRRDVELEWNLLDQPSRLRVQTIDSFCASLTRQMPIVSEMGAPMRIEEHAQPLYLQAARDTLALMTDPDWSDCITLVLKHLDNNLLRVESLLAEMLARRDQWLRHLAGTQTNGQRTLLESALHSVVSQAIARLLDAIPPDSKIELNALAAFAASQIDDPQHPVKACGHPLADDADTLTRLAHARGWADLLLKRDKAGSWRSSVDKRNGFPSIKGKSVEAERCQAMKARMLALLEALAPNEALRQSLFEIGSLPEPGYTQAQWQVIDALFRLLPMAVAQLRLVFQAQGCVDYCEIAHAAARALGDELEPTDLALRLDYQIQHVLVDEFQDTSETQFELLSRLLSGWDADGDRTLFLVGDPMQSIYRFRQAEVGLFLQAQRHGVGPIHTLQPITLQANFRSQAGVVDWINQAFPNIFPDQDDLARGAIRYAPSIASHAATIEPGVCLHALPFEKERRQEAEQLCELVQRIRIDCPGDRIAILVRGRSALQAILPQLKQAGLAFAAQDIDPLGSLPIIKDLMALTRALLHRADRVAWLSILRAPWCGLTLADLLALVSGSEAGLIWDLLCDEKRIASLSPDGQQRLARVRQALTRAFASQAQMALRDWVHACWLALAGPSCLEDVTDLDNARRFFDLLDEMTQGADIIDFTTLQQRVDELYAAPQTDPDHPLQIMTLHKAKGLEFDHVLIPGLDRKPPGSKRRLLNWMERPVEQDAHNDSELLLAPIPATGDEQDATSRYLQRLQDDKERFEIARLLYVGLTRAKKQAHLWFQLKEKTDGEWGSPADKSLLQAIWSAIAEDPALHLAAIESETIHQETAVNNQNIKRIMSDMPAAMWPENYTGLSLQTRPKFEELQSIEFDWAGQSARLVGIVTHQLLHRMGLRGPTIWQGREPTQRQRMVETLLVDQGIDSNQLADATQRVVQNIEACLKDSRGQWVLNPQHTESACEWAISGVLDGEVIRAVIDRTFVDEHGTRWIIDYKTGMHEGSDTQTFIDQEVVRYRAQLQTYGRLLRLREDRPIQLALYFPALSAWRDWCFED